LITPSLQKALEFWGLDAKKETAWRDAQVPQDQKGGGGLPAGSSVPEGE